VAYAFCKDNAIPGKNDIHVVLRWSEAHGFNEDQAKVPSQIYYANPQAEPLFGVQIPEGVKPICWFKLLLLEERDLPRHLRQAEELKQARYEINKLGKEVVEVVADYLKMLWKAALEDVRITYSSLINISRFCVVLTIPAIWPDNALDTMKEAARRAGILDPRGPDGPGSTMLHVVSEPEAAALASLQCDMVPRPDFGPGDTFIVLDCGGGTAVSSR
jgi:molecular chaperone DnaK (HSP70)